MSIKKLTLGFATLALAFSLVVAPVASAQTSTNNSILKDALILDSTDRGSSLGDLFILDRLFSDGSGGILNDSGSDLGDLFLLDQLFSGGDSILGGDSIGGGILGDGNSLGDLFVLDRLFGDNSDILSGDGNGSDLGDLFILDQLFR
ncbi:MAG: hypothetical protein UT48_C0001G0025 [Parcubacteria group bacterium GW2011_GWE2_39_37]|uniref:Uncharacterized protein n=1 Tax=Candidatus Falkowbacteria bacterium GW2011_GWF2_39_8 TaxID=1618642 RepID=A0A0G0PYK3_9BACT|nr:MAG: hypothetical protein UT48_C0001G0025 [Parcubacteria group bacterium GW2011_GWE2_39_37]KKR33224.1 MAG: hypothetical protein UT64_C0012G0016 [Candidatus Falkowbacteria bacterium GW2011_GWF2_39_8]